jgi:hypothetical protein
MKSFANLLNLYTSVTQNGSSDNQSFGQQLMGDQHRFLIEKYFDNERQFFTTTVGAMNLAITGTLNVSALSATLTGSWNYQNGTQGVIFTNLAAWTTATTTVTLALNATSGTLSINWTGPTGLQSVTFNNTNQDVRDVSFTNGSTAISWTPPLTGATTTTSLTFNATSQSVQVTFDNSSTTINWTTPLTYGISNTAITTAGFQKYAIPANISKLTNSTISIGQLRFVPAPVQTREAWDRLNFLPYSSDIPNYFFIYNGFVEFWPLPSTTGNTIAFNYKGRIPEFSTAFLFSDTSGTAYVAGQTVFDYQNGAITTAAVGSVNITGTGTSWNTTGKFPLNVDVSAYNLYLIINAPYGDGIWYPIQQFNSDTTLVLAKPIQNAPAISNVAHNYSIGQLPVLSEDFHDMLVYGAAMTYYNSIVPDQNRFRLYEKMYAARLELLSEYAGTKQVNYNLGEQPAMLNPNNYPFYPNGVKN